MGSLPLLRVKSFKIFLVLRHSNKKRSKKKIVHIIPHTLSLIDEDNCEGYLEKIADSSKSNWHNEGTKSSKHPQQHLSNLIDGTCKVLHQIVH